MKKSLFLLALLGCSALGSTARADVSWEHRGALSVGPKPVVYFRLKNDWSGQKHRANVLVDATSGFGAMSVPGGPPKRGEVNVIERLDDDHLILTTDQTKAYFDEPYRSLKSRIRLNFWEALGSNLSPDNIPQLTLEQRQRLGQEIRAVAAPALSKMTRTYFRAIPEKKTISGMSSQGYRYTSMFNTSVEKSKPEWVRITAEWWIADVQAGDDEIRSFTQSANEIKMGGGGPTVSMWLNETYPILWEAAPVEMHQALASMIGEVGTQNFGYQGTPMQFNMTIAPPPMESMGMGGNISLSLDLTKKTTTAIDQAIFDAPKDGQKIDIEPFIGMAKNGLKMGRAEIEKALQE